MAKNVGLSSLVGFDWDKGNLAHINKHKVTYTECEEAFGNKPFLLNYDHSHSVSEGRFQALGITTQKKLLFLSFTIRNNKIRIISARVQNKKERLKFLKL